MMEDRFKDYTHTDDAYPQPNKEVHYITEEDCNGTAIMTRFHWNLVDGQNDKPLKLRKGDKIIYWKYCN